ncbi:hypothetical protein [Mesorhizobium sp.]|uniref:hypothetical protein n=1 Tax=Mesorhizobium sp. TaxID=1871066 RepID=UPI0025C6513B|nr:hypothetical protein [Mesorhizobium sp.]
MPLIEAVKRIPEMADKLEDVGRTLELMTGIYEQAARDAATHRRRRPRPEPGGDDSKGNG